MNEEKANETAVIMPFSYQDDEHYYVEDLGQIEKKTFYSFVKGRLI
jgi:hypothetical protein